MDLMWWAFTGIAGAIVGAVLYGLGYRDGVRQAEMIFGKYLPNKPPGG